MVSRVQNLLHTIARLQKKILKDTRIPKGPAQNRCKVAYEGARTQLENWLIMARPHVAPLPSALFRREEGVRRPRGPAARMHTVHALLHELADLY